MAKPQKGEDGKIGERIRIRLKEMGKSQRWLVTDGLTPAYLSRIINGLRRPSSELVDHLAEKLVTSSEWLRTGHKSMLERGLEVGSGIENAIRLLTAEDRIRLADEIEGAIFHTARKFAEVRELAKPERIES